MREHTRKGELTASQRFALGRLSREGPLTVTALARAEGVRPQSMGATVAVLEAQGLVAGAPDPADGRQTLLSLTEVRDAETVLITGGPGKIPMSALILRKA